MPNENPLKGNPLVTGFKQHADEIKPNNITKKDEETSHYREKLAWKSQVVKPMWTRFIDEENIKNKPKNLELILDELSRSTRDPRVLKEISTFHQKFEEIKTKKDVDSQNSELDKLGKNIKNFYEEKGNF